MQDHGGLIVGHAGRVVGGGRAVDDGQRQRIGSDGQGMPGIERDVDDPEVPCRIAHHEQEIHLADPAVLRALSEERHGHEQEEQAREEHEPGERVHRLRLIPEHGQKQERAARPRQAVQRGPAPKARDGQHEEIEHEQIDEEIALVGPLDAEQQGREETAQHRERRGDLPTRRHRHGGAEQGHREHAAEGGRRAEQAVEDVGRPQREVEHAQAEAGQAFAQIRHVAAPVQAETREQQDHPHDRAERHARARSEQVTVEGPLQKEADGEEERDDAHPRRPARADALLEIERRRYRRRRRGRSTGAPGNRPWRRRGGGRRDLGSEKRRPGLVRTSARTGAERRGGPLRMHGCLDLNGRLGRRRSGSRRGGAALERPHAIEEAAHLLLEHRDPIVGRRRRLPAPGGAIGQDRDDDGGERQQHVYEEAAEGEDHRG